MSRGFKRFFAVLLLVAAFNNGLFGPLAHSHMAGAAPQNPHESNDTLTGATAAHAGCHAEEPDDDGDQPRAKHPSTSGMLCSGSAACCAAVAVIELPIIPYRERVGPEDYLRPGLAGLSPPVGERPPSQV